MMNHRDIAGERRYRTNPDFACNSVAAAPHPITVPPVPTPIVLSVVLKSAQTQPICASTHRIMPLRTAATAGRVATARKLPILLFDVMDTIVRDPFYHDVPAFFGMSMKELLECKHPTAWIDFEKGLINEMEMIQIFFKDGRPVDLQGLKSRMRQGYSYIEGVEVLLDDLKKNGFEMHAFTNYPVWYEIIEERLKLSTYLSWTFCSCIIGKRKPDPDFYMEVSRHLKVDPTSCILIDDRMRNVEAAREAGFIGIQFKNVELLRKDLMHQGILI